MKRFVECSYKGQVHTHTINFDLKSCTCRWFRAFSVCAHLVCACDLYNRDLKGYKKPKVFVFRPKRGRKPKAITFTELAFTSDPMPIIAIPDLTVDNRPDLYLKKTNNMPGLPSINSYLIPEIVESEKVITRVTRSYNKKAMSEIVVDRPQTVKRLRNKVVPVVEIPLVEKRSRGRPKKNGPALSI